MTTGTQLRRKGAAVVEFAICFPIVAAIIVAGMDITQVLRAKQAVVEATHETARVVATNEADEHQFRKFATDLLALKDLSGATVTVDPPPSPKLDRVTPITVSVSIPIDSNCTLIPHYFAPLTLNSQSTVSREFGDFPKILSDDD